MSKIALLIAKNWPEPNSTAAGRRTLDVFKLLLDAGFELHVASPAEPTPFQHNSEQWQCHAILLNDSSFEPWLQTLNPNLVIYDRFVMEEQFGWRVREALPSAATLLDTSDLHCLRIAREQSFKQQQPLNLYNDIALREISAITRCDLTLMISRIEIEILVENFAIEASKLVYLPFITDTAPPTSTVDFIQRQHLMMIGGFKHEPNRDATRWLHSDIWPILQKKLPKGTELHIYGAYADHAMNQLHNPKHGFFIKGRAENPHVLMQHYRINLAPLRFGAGQKGKVFEGWLYGIPTITTPVGAESMASADELGYPLTDNVESYSALVAQCYTDSIKWRTIQSNGYRIITERFITDQYRAVFINAVTDTLNSLSDIRQDNFWQRLLWQQQFSAQKYLSRWIEVKNQVNAK